MFRHESTEDPGPKESVSSDMPDLSRQKAQCLCAGCPSSPQGSMVYCIRGKGDAVVPAGKSCSCKSCSVWSELGMAFDRFCEKGSEKEQQDNDILVIY